MTREQALFAAASLFQDFIDLPMMIKNGEFLDADSSFFAALVEADHDLRQARAAYEGKAVDDAGFVIGQNKGGRL